MSEQALTFQGITPNLHYDDLPAMITWLTRVFGFIEKGRWVNDSGAVTNAEMLAGATEVWLDGDPDCWQSRRPEEWLGVWVSDVEAMHKRVTTAGVASPAPATKFYGVRVLQVTDPGGVRLGVHAADRVCGSGACGGRLTPCSNGPATARCRGPASGLAGGVPHGRQTASSIRWTRLDRPGGDFCRLRYEVFTSGWAPGRFRAWLPTVTGHRCGGPGSPASTHSS